MKRIFLVTAALTLPLVSAAEEYNNKQIMQEIKLLKQQVQDLEQKLSKANAENKKINLESQKLTAIQNKNEQNITKDSKKSDDKPISQNSPIQNIKLSGKIEFDSAYIDKTDNTKNTLGTRIRTASIAVDGPLPGDLKYKFEVNFAGDKVSLKKAYFDYSGLKFVNLRAGRFVQDFGMNSDSKFPEEAPALSQKGGVATNDGIRISASGDKWYSSIGFGSVLLSSEEKKNNFKNIFFRQTYSPIITDKFILHTGISGIIFQSKDAESKIEYKAGFDTAYYDSAINTSVDKVKNVKVLGLDLGSVYGPFSIQGEYIRSFIKSNDNAQPKKNIKGSYVQVAYSLTGEERGYNPSDNGNFTAIIPNQDFSLKDGGIGAWEIAFRYNQLDLENFKGGKMHSFSSSLNWYWNKNFNLKFSYIKGSSLKHETNNIVRRKPNIFMLRAALNF